MRLKSDDAIPVEKITRHSRWRGIQISKEHLILADGTKIHPRALMNVGSTALLCAQLNRQHSELQLRVWKLENALKHIGGNWRAALTAVK